jgi:hypothetical protein
MRKSATKNGAGGLARWQVVLCLLLAALVVYNPYLAGAGSGTGLCVQHSASYRATVGASELQHFTPQDGRGVLAAATPAILFFLNYLVGLRPEARRYAERVVAPKGISLPASLWFRPPPSH